MVTKYNIRTTYLLSRQGKAKLIKLWEESATTGTISMLSNEGMRRQEQEVQRLLQS